MSLVYAQVTRQFSSTTIDTDATLTITYSESGQYSIIETIPSGWSKVSGPGTVTAGKLRLTTSGTVDIGYQAPSTQRTSTFNGKYVIAPDLSYTNFASQVITVIPGGGCDCSGWSNGACGGGTCTSTEILLTRTCTPSGCSSESDCQTDASCVSGCESDSDCSGGTPYCNSAGNCVECLTDTHCTETDETCSGGTCKAPEECEFWEKDDGGECKMNTPMIIMVFFALFLLSKM